MRIEQELKNPCAVCEMMSQKKEPTVQDKREYKSHLQRVHALKPFYIQN